MSDLPTGWADEPIDALGEIVGGGTPSRAAPSFWGGSIPWVTPTDITALTDKYVRDTPEKITNDGLAGSAARLLPHGSIVVTTRATLGEAAIAAVPLTTNQGFKNIIPNETTDAAFTYYLLKTLRPAMLRLASGTTFPEISKKDFSKIRIQRPIRPEQERIATVLDTAEEAIAKTEAVIGKLRQVRTGLADELLTQAAATVAPSRLSTVALPRFSSVDKLTVGGEEPVRLCNYTDVYKHDYITADMEFMHATATLDEIAQFRLQVGDVIITKDSESPDDIGIPCVIDSTAPDLLCGYHLALIRPNQDRVDSTYLALQLAHHRLAAYFGQQAVGSTRYGLSVACIANAPILLPPIEEQREAGKLIRLQDAQIRQHEAELIKLQSIKSGLMDDLLTGRVRVPQATP